MRALSELSTVTEVDELIDMQICRNLPAGFRAEVEAGTWSIAQRAADPKLDAVCRALERRGELESAELQTRILPYLYIGKGMRVCDLQLYFQQYPESAIERAAEAAVLAGKAQRYEYGGQVFYLLKEVAG